MPEKPVITSCRLSGKGKKECNPSLKPGGAYIDISLGQGYILVIFMPTIVHFDLPADDVERARTFYTGLFDWKFIAPPGFSDYYLFETLDLEGKPSLGGGLGKRGSPDQRIMNYFGVFSIEQYCEKVQRLGGRVIVPKMIVPMFGYMAVCTDTEGNQFGLWQDDPEAK